MSLFPAPVSWDRRYASRQLGILKENSWLFFFSKITEKQLQEARLAHGYLEINSRQETFKFSAFPETRDRKGHSGRNPVPFLEA